MIRRTWIARLFAAAAAITVAGTQATAGVLPTSVTVSQDGGNYRWTYAIVLPTDMKLQSGNYFTIYDFAGYVAGGESAPTGWKLTASNTGTTPDRLTPHDDPNVTNLTWTYTGPTVPSGQVGLGNFWAMSSYSEKNLGDGSFTAQTNRTSDGAVDRNITETQTPVVNPTNGGGGGGGNGGNTGVTPEPATLALAGLGLPLVGLARLRRRNKK